MPAITIVDLNNAKADADHIADVATSTSPTATDRKGNTKKTITGVIADAEARADDAMVEIVDNIGNHYADTYSAAPPSGGARLVDIVAPAAGAGGIVTDDPNPALNGWYRKTGAAGVAGWERLERQPASEAAVSALDATVSSLDALRVNRGKDFPLRPATRLGVTSPASPVWLDFLLGIQIIGAADGKLYRVPYQRNEASGTYGFGWTITEHDAADYETSTAPTVVVHELTAPVPDIDRAGGVQTIRFQASLRPDLEIQITVDAAALPPAGTPIDSNSTASPGWSWYIDPSCYLPVRKFDALTINKGRHYPLKPMARAGVVSAEQTVWSNLILDTEVLWGEGDKIYRLAYQQNQANIGGDTDFGWIIEEFPAATYATTGAGRVQIHNHSDPAPWIDRAGGIQTIVIEPVLRPNIRIRVTLDASALPAAGTPINSYLDDTFAGWSWVIDPSRVTLAPTAAPVSAWDGRGVYWTYAGGEAGELVCHYRSGNLMYRVSYGRKGVNMLPDIKDPQVAPFGDPATAAWVTIQNTASGGDWTPPFQIEAVDGGDGTTNVQSTGGNHGKNGGTGGGATARNIAFRVFADGAPIAPGQSGVASVGVGVALVNEIMAHNTRTLDRYVSEQSARLTFVPGGIWITHKHRALEDILVLRDGGCQTFTSWFNDAAGSTMMYYGRDNTRKAYVSGNNSGTKAAAPNVFALVLKDGVQNLHAVWMDNGFEAGDRANVASSAPLLTGGAPTLHKYYNPIVWDTSLALSAGESYQWRGGWVWQEDTTAPSVGVDAQFTAYIGGVMSTVFGADDGTAWSL